VGLTLHFFCAYVLAMTLEQLRASLKAHLEKTGEAYTTFGRRVMGDPSWTTRFIEENSEPKEKTRAKVAKAIQRGKK
jgi:hypothetical protein